MNYGDSPTQRYGGAGPLRKATAVESALPTFDRVSCQSNVEFVVALRTMKEMLAVGVGGFIGSVARYKIGGFLLHHSTNWRFPLSTFAINVTGCFAIGALGALVERHDLFSPTLRLFLFTGLLGGYTTFSAFGFEGVYLLRRGEISVALGYAILSVICGFGAVWLALKLFSFGRH